MGTGMRFVLEIGRPVRQQAEEQLGPVDDCLSVPRAVAEVEIPKLASEAYRRIMRLASGGNEVEVVLSGPLALSFLLGQAIGLGKARVRVYQWSAGRYEAVPPLTREHLFQEGET
jgi:hypothetical protein